MYVPTTWVTGDTITATKANNGETQFKEATDETRSQVAIASNTLILNLATSRVFEVLSFNANIGTLTLQNIPAAGRRAYFELWLKQDGVARTVTWPAAIKWDGGVAPIFPGTSGKYAGLAFEEIDGGATWWGVVLGLAF